VAPFDVGLVNIKPGDAAVDAACGELDRRLAEQGIDVLYDDTEARAGAKFAAMDLIGLPWQTVIGPRGVANGTIELKCRASGERVELPTGAALARLAEAGIGRKYGE
jgi:prolyl-tRNA synthetase